MCWGAGRLAVSGDFTSESGIRTYSRNRDCTERNSEQ